MEPTRYLTEKQVAELTAKALSTLRNDRHMRRGIPYIKDGASVRYNIADVVLYMEQKKIVFEEA
jgi:hypothetical protein